ncbi:MAG: hypothetical protein LC803_22560 [Acidobacteria bacterium]|nr:hypothetical protein [Acidobacteriota bacterium]
MMHLVLDAMNDASRWSPLAPDGVTASAQISMSNDPDKFRYGADGVSARVNTTNAARGHTLRRTLPPADLSNFDELRFWFRSTRAADGSPARPFFLRLRLGSAAMPLADASNAWFRYLPAFRAEAWELVRVSIADLAPQVRGALSVLELASVDDASSECNLDGLLAAREQMLGDVETEMIARLHQRLSVGGAAVAARVHNPDDPAVAAMPYIQIIPRAIQLSAERSTSGETRTDFTENSFRLRPPSVPYDLYYDIDVFAQNRPHKAEIYEFVLKTLSPRSELIVNGMPLMVELINVIPEPRVALSLPDRTLLSFKVATWQTAGVSTPAVLPYRDVSIGVSAKAPV